MSDFEVDEAAGVIRINAPQVVTYTPHWQASIDGEHWHDMKPPQELALAPGCTCFKCGAPPSDSSQRPPPSGLPVCAGCFHDYQVIAR